MFAASNVAREYASTGTCKIARESGENANSLASRARHARLRVLLKDRGILHPEVDSYKAADDYISEHGALPREKSTEMLLTRKPCCPVMDSPPGTGTDTTTTSFIVSMEKGTQMRLPPLFMNHTAASTDTDNGTVNKSSYGPAIVYDNANTFSAYADGVELSFSA